MSQELRLLLVEDMPDDALLLERELRKGGYAVQLLRVETAPELRRALDGDQWDLVISDYNLPQFSGRAALEIVMNHVAELPVIIVSGAVGEEAAIAALHAGANDYVMKNKLAKLVPAVERVLRETQLQRERKEEERARRLRAEQVIRHQAALLGLTKARSESVEESIAAITQVAAQTLEAERASVWRFSDDGAELRCDSLFCLSTGERPSVEALVVADNAAYFWALEESRTLAADDAPTDPRTRILNRHYLEPAGIGALLDVPIRSAGRWIGVVCLEHVGGVRHWTLAEREFAASVADIVASTFEVSERKRAQSAFGESEQRFHSVAESAQDAIISTDEAGRIAFWNGAAERLFGYNAKEALELPFERLVAQSHRALFERAAHEPQRALEIAGRHANGREFPIELSVASWQAGDAVFRTMIVRDISERVRNEARIRRQANLLDLAQDAIAVRDLSGCIEYWNKGAEQLYGWASEEVLGKSMIDLVIRDRRGYEIAEEALLREGEWSGTMTHVTRRETPVVVDSRWDLVLDEEGRPASVLTISTDQTEKKDLETRFLRAQRMESIGRLASGIAHDLNNILTPILTSVYLLREGAAPENLERILSMVEGNARRAVSVVEQVLTFGRGLEGERAPVQPRHLIRDMVEIAHETFPKNIHIRTDISAELATVVGDATQLHQVLLNLFVNARDAMPEGGTLSIQASNVQLRENDLSRYPDAKPGRFVRITVTDTGSGIPGHVVDKIFDPFFTTKPTGEGTGLGLSTVHGLAKGHGGFVMVEGREGEGARFSVFLPAGSEEEVQAAETEPVPMRKGKGELIMVVDDESTVGEMTCTILEAHGYRAINSRDGVEALAAFADRQDDVSLMVVDLMMPRLDGRALARTLHTLRPNLPIVAMTGLAADPEQVALGDDFCDLLRKPFITETLMTAIGKALDRDAPEDPGTAAPSSYS